MSRPRATVNGNHLEKWLMTGPDYCAMRGWSQQTLRKYRKKNPPCIHVGGVSYYSIQDIESHLRSKEFQFDPYDPNKDFDSNADSLVGENPLHRYLLRMNAVVGRR